MKENSTVWCILPIFKKKKKKSHLRGFVFPTINLTQGYTYVNLKMWLITHFLQDHIGVPWLSTLPPLCINLHLCLPFSFLWRHLFFFSGSAVSHTHHFSTCGTLVSPLFSNNSLNMYHKIGFRCHSYNKMTNIDQHTIHHIVYALVIIYIYVYEFIIADHCKIN